MYSTELLDRILFATRYTRHLDKNGYLRFQNWKLYGERGLAKAPVTVWIYEDSLKVEHQAVTLSKYSIQVQDDHKHLQTVSHPRLSQTPFRSPQLALFDLGPGEWLLYWKTPDQVPTPRKHRITDIIQLPLLETSLLERVVGTEIEQVESHPRTHLRLVSEQQIGHEPEE